MNDIKQITIKMSKGYLAWTPGGMKAAVRRLVNDSAILVRSKWNRETDDYTAVVWYQGKPATDTHIVADDEVDYNQFQ